MSKLDLSNLDSIIENLKNSESCIRDILEKQTSTLFHTMDYYEGELKVYEDVILMLKIYQNKKVREDNQCIEEGKAHLWWMLDNGIFTSEDEPHIEAVLEYIEQLEQEKADRTSAESYENSYIAKLESDKQKLIEILEKANKEDTNTVKYYEKQRRLTTDDFYKKSYQTQIHKANSRREVRKNILEIVKGENQVTVK